MGSLWNKYSKPFCLNGVSEKQKGYKIIVKTNK